MNTKNKKIRITLFNDWSRFKELANRYPYDSIQQVEKCKCGKLRPVCYVMSLEGEILEKYIFCPECTINNY